jgi:uracil phosphoribosyltransferase
MPESAYLDSSPQGHRLVHDYGKNVHILADPWSLSILARLCHPTAKTPEVHVLLDAAYRRLLEAACEQLPTVAVDLETRMTARDPGARFQGRIIDRSHRAVVVDVARAGMIPAHLFQLGLHEVLDSDGVRVDHLFMDRAVDPQTGAVSGIAFHGSKIGGPIDGSTMFVPDPMGATGRSLVHAIRHYEEKVGGRPHRVVCCHLIVTPEFVRRVQDAFPDAVIYALRLDRGLSPADVLAERPGKRWSEEKGLDAHDYIVPGAGGLGELINNAFV